MKHTLLFALFFILSAIVVRYVPPNASAVLKAKSCEKSAQECQMEEERSTCD